MKKLLLLSVFVLLAAGCTQPGYYANGTCHSYDGKFHESVGCLTSIKEIRKENSTGPCLSLTNPPKAEECFISPIIYKEH